jgi:translation initiation factor 3 subunit G
MAAAAAQQKIRWGELEEDDGGDLDFLLPPRVVVGPDENGLKKVIEYRFDDDGNKVRVTTTTRVRKLARARLSRSAIERRQWPKFGDALKEDAGSRLTMVSTEEILLERPRAPGLDLLATCFRFEYPRRLFVRLLAAMHDLPGSNLSINLLVLQLQLDAAFVKFRVVRIVLLVLCPSSLGTWGAVEERYIGTRFNSSH